MQLGCASTMDPPARGFSAQSLSPRAPATPSCSALPALPCPPPTYAEPQSQETHFPPRLEQGHCHPWMPCFSLRNVN